MLQAIEDIISKIKDKDLESFQWRCERKFTISNLSFKEVEKLVKLHPAMFSEIYYQRFVNNIYFDSFEFKNYFDSISGSSERIKVRIRWYGDLFGFIENPALELKIKTGSVNRKKVFPFKSFYLNKDFTIEKLKQTINSSALPEILKKELLCLKPVVLNRYRRKYFQSADKDYRLTIDSEMSFYKINDYANHFLVKTGNSEADIVIELKYNKENEDKIRKIANFFPFRLSKMSKYINGLEAFNSFL